jgi:ribosome-associated heat shock protein Hsp15
MNRTSSGQGLRIDSWLWYTRFFKTRSAAAAAVSGGQVKINGQRVKPGSRVAPGDGVRIVRNQVEHDIQIALIPKRRGPAAEAQQCYVESEASRLKREAMIDSLRRDRSLMPRTEGRPDKRTRRQVRQFNREPRDD